MSAAPLSLEKASIVREILSDEVKAAYRAETDSVARAELAADLRAQAKQARAVREFDSVFSSFKRSVDEEERAILAQAKEEQRIDNSGRCVSIETVLDVLKDIDITVRYNQLLREVEVKGLPFYYSEENAANVLPVFLRDHMKACDYEGATVLNIEGCLNCIADRNRYNPIKEYLNAGIWDGIDRFPEIYRILGVYSPRHQTYIRKWFVQCVALGLNDEEDPIGADGVLVLQGEQGLAKTSFFRIMAPFPRWFVEGTIIDMRDKDSQIKALRGWIAELGELDSTLKKEQSSLKAFVTLPEDRIRLPYARNETRSPRRTSFCGTVNPKDYLKDETGSRRFWTVPITSVDKKALFSLRAEWINQVWYQCYQLYKSDPNGFRLTDAELKELQAENKEFEQSIPYELEILDKLDFSMPVERWEWWSSAEVAELMRGVADAKKVGKALAKIARDNGIDVPDAPETYKKSHGTRMRLLPLLHAERPEDGTAGYWGIEDDKPL